MTLRNLLLTSVFGLVIGTSTACAGQRYLATVIAPPPPRYGAVGYAPRPGYLWCDGYWDWRGRAWVWLPGYWAKPPRPHSAWVPGYWRPHRGGHAFVRGYWRR